MPDIESPEAFSERVRDAWVHGEGSLADVIASLIRARDAAVRREAFAEASAVAERAAAAQDGVSWWSNAARSAAVELLTEAASDIRALATGGSDG